MSIIRYFIVITIILLGLMLLMFQQSDTIRAWLNPDVLIVAAYGDIDKKQVEILWTSEGRQDTISIFRNGLVRNANYKGAGHNNFFVYYKESMIGEFNIFKSEIWNGHEYYIELSRYDNNVTMSVNIKGPDSHR